MNHQPVCDKEEFSLATHNVYFWAGPVRHNVCPAIGPTGSIALISTNNLSIQSLTKAVFSFFKIPKNLQDSPSHRIFGRMHGVLNIGKKNNQLHSLSVNVETNLLSLVSLWLDKFYQITTKSATEILPQLLHHLNTTEVDMHPIHDYTWTVDGRSQTSLSELQRPWWATDGSIHRYRGHTWLGSRSVAAALAALLHGNRGSSLLLTLLGRARNGMARTRLCR
jgi:hypothetical protein